MLFEEGETPTALKVKVLFATDDVKALRITENVLSNAAVHCQDAIGPLAEERGNSKQVIVTGIREDCTLPTNSDTGYAIGDMFPSAAAASRELGYKYNEVALALGAAKSFAPTHLN